MIEPEPANCLIIIPTYNEVDNIEAITSAIWQNCPQIHILVVDDNSTDGTKDVLTKISSTCGQRFFVLPREGKLGLGTAYIAGFKWALGRHYEAVLEMDADFSHNPLDVTRHLQNLRDCDVGIGSRYVKGGGTENWSLLRQAISRFGSFYARQILGLPVADLTGGFNSWRRKVIESINLDEVKSEGYSFQIELKFRAHKRGFRLREFPILFSERRAGQSKMSLKIVIEAMIKVWSFRFTIK